MITEDEIRAAQESWGQGLIEIGAAQSWQAARSLASDFIRSHYLIEDGALQFCPTKARKQQFRPDLRSALSYFVGRDTHFPEDRGFALEPWCSVGFDNAGGVRPSQEVSGVALAMGNYFFGRADGSEVKVEYSFAYIRDAQGSVKIQLHHSALPYEG